MPGEHARLSPSAAERWLSCPASIAMVASVPPEPDSVYAAEGTCAHELGEIKLRYAFGQISRNQYQSRVAKWRKQWAVTDATEFEMDGHTDAYVALIQERAALYPNTQVMVEQRLDTGVPTCWGTSDTVLVSPRHVEVVDFKYGRGVAVEAEGNPQTRLYLLGALDTYGDLLGDTEVAMATIFQPRLDHTLTETLTPQELRDWRTSILPIAEEALGPNARFGPSEVACRWCPASGNCRAQLESIFNDELLDFETPPDVLSDQEIADLLGKVDAVKAWCEALEMAAFMRAYGEGKHLPGYKVVLSGGKRSIPDPEAAVAFMITELGYEEDQVARRSPKTLGDLEALMGKKEFATKMADFIKPPVGKPSLVPESDKRPAINPNAQAATEFAATLREEDVL